jgi:hypothetical protein
MRSRILVAAFLFAAAQLSSTGAVRASTQAGTEQWAITYLAEPTLIGSTIVQGPVLFVHDGAKMARGEPCTTIRLFEPGKGPAEELVSFHCIPKARRVVGKFTITTKPNLELGFGCILTEYQFAGDAEGHGVPVQARVNAN